MRFVPDTIAGRTISVLLLGLVALHLASIWAYQLGLDTEISLTNAARTAERLLAIRDTLAKTPEDNREETAHALSGGPLEVHYSSVQLAVTASSKSPGLTELTSEIAKRAPELPGRDWMIAGAPATVEGRAADPHLTLISMKLPDTGWVNATVAVMQGTHTSLQAVLVSTGLMALGVLGMSLAIMRGVTKPIRRCADEAQRVYASAEPQPIAIGGPQEVRELATAFNEMQQRVKRLVDDRTLTVAAISHDLKTPLSRVQLRLEEYPPDELRQQIEADLDEMLAMIDSSLEFLKRDYSGEELQRVDLGAIIGTVCDDFADRGHHVEFSRKGNMVLIGRRLALKRVFANLVGNAVKYGKEARVNVEGSERHVRVSIEDSGPGIPPEQLEKVFAPFHRVETSRSRETGGTGLGLTVAQTIIAAHGGSIELKNLERGGLRVAVLLPTEFAEANSIH